MLQEHYQYLFDSLQVGLEDERYDTQVSLPLLSPSLPPPEKACAVITLDGEDYIVSIEPRIPRQCDKSLHGRHTPVGGICIGCGTLLEVVR